jgi:hypothetical protein
MQNDYQLERWNQPAQVLMLHLLLAHGNPWAGCCTYIITSSL